MINNFELLENIVRENLLCLFLLVLLSKILGIDLVLFYFCLEVALFTYSLFCMGLLDIYNIDSSDQYFEL